MLVISRQAGESFRVGDNVEVRILSVRGGTAKIGVIAPREIGIFRTELARINHEASKGWNKDSLAELASRLRKGEP